ncbi:MAG: DUF4430 domain-containing protein [Eubacteriales bacterium]|nr:DUF4430 domain-containing protein [Eubacteriales bacterium]
MKRKRYQLLMSTLLAASMTVQSPMLALASDFDEAQISAEVLADEGAQSAEMWDETDSADEAFKEDSEAEEFVEDEEDVDAEEDAEGTDAIDDAEDFEIFEDEEDDFISEADTLESDLSYSVKVAAVGDILDGYLVTPQTVTVGANEAESYGFTDLEGDYVTTLDVLVKMHEITYGDSFTAETASSYLGVSSSGYINKLFETSTGNVGFTVNGIVPNDGVVGDYGYDGYTVDQAVVTENDDIFFFLYQDSDAMDYMGWFVDENGVKKTEFEAEAGTPLTIGCKGYESFGWNYLSPDLEDHVTEISYATIMSALESGAPDGVVVSEPTDEDGMTTLTFEEAGEYYIIMHADEDEYPIISPIAKVTVTAPFALEGDGTEENPYILSSAEGLTYVSDKVNNQGETYNGCYFAITKDITLPEGWEPIGKRIDNKTVHRFGGYIDGGDHLLTIPAGEKCLLGNTAGAKLENLNIYGTQIASAGVLETYEVGVTLDCSNVTLKSGTQTLMSGFLGGYGNESANITNCTVEEGVVIGYNKDQTNIGSFGGDFNGTITNCSSAATVYGVNYVGGICGNKGQSMRTYKILDCTFTGTVEASGNYVGGISGGGYGGTRWGIDTAPNTGTATIENCEVYADITGANYVGGILGAEPGVVQTWNNGIGSIKNNYFNGTVTATEEAAYVGGIIGYFHGLDRYNEIAENVYNCQADVKGIGHITYIDTNYENPAAVEGVTYYNTENGKPDFKIAYCSFKQDHNRTDDPLGADADLLARREKAKIQVTASLFGDDVHDSDKDGAVHTNRGHNLTEWAAAETYTVYEDAYVIDVFEAMAEKYGLTFENESGNYIQSITKDDVVLGEFTNGKNSGWMYTLNGEYPDYGVAEQHVSADDVLVFHYTDNYNREFLLDTPVLTGVSYAAGGVKIAWEPVNWAEKYRVFRKEKGGNWKKVGETENTSLIDTTGKTNTTYTYTVRCISADGSYYASEYDKKGKSIRYIPSGVITSLKSGASGITVTWKKVAGAQSYVLYRADGSGKFAVLATVKGANTVTYADKKATANGQKYKYAVRPVIGKDKGYYIAKETYYLAAPKISSASNNKAKSISVAWNKNAKAAGYQVYYKTSGSAAKTVTIKENTKLNTLISSLKKGTSYNVYVRSYITESDKNYYSAWSPVKTVKISK